MKRRALHVLTPRPFQLGEARFATFRHKGVGAWRSMI